MTDFPIDINYNDLIQWLRDRYLIPDDWPKRLEFINTLKIELITEISNITDKDFDKIKEIVNKEPELNYDHMKRIQVLILKTNEAKKKTLLGYYSSSVVKKCEMIVKTYEDKNIYFTEYAKILSQKINFDIDNLEKQISNNTKYIDDFSFKIDESKNDKKNKESKTNEFFSNVLLDTTTFLKINSVVKEFEGEKISKNEANEKINLFYIEISKNMINRLNFLKKSILEFFELVTGKDFFEILDFYKTMLDQNKNNGDIVNNLLPEIKQLKQVKVDEKKLENLLSSKISLYNDQLEKVENIKAYVSNLEFNKKHNNEIKENKDEGIFELILNRNSRIKLYNNLKEVINFLKFYLVNLDSSLYQKTLLYNSKLRELSNTFNKEKVLSYCDKIKNVVEIFDNENTKFNLRLYESKFTLFEIIEDIELRIENIFRTISNQINFSIKIKELNDVIKEDKVRCDEYKKEIKNIKKTIDKNLSLLCKRKISIMGNKYLF